MPNANQIINRRIFIVSDILHKDELDTAKEQTEMLLRDLKEPFRKKIFDETFDFAWHKDRLPIVWEAIKAADEIYASSSLMPLVGNSYMGAPVILNEMMRAALKEGVIGKKFILLNKAKNIYWDKRMHDIKLLSEVFGPKKNSFLTCEYGDDGYKLVPLDIKAVIKKLK